jgi:hypothetical protein
VELMVTDRLPCATAQGPSVTASFSTTEPVRALSTMRAARRSSSTGRFSMSARKPTRASLSAGTFTRTTRPSSALAVPSPLALLMALATARAVAKSLLLRSSRMLSPWFSGVGTERSTVAPFGDAAGRQVVDLHLAATGRRTGAADDQVALRQRVDLAVGALQRRGDQRAAAQALGVADRGHRHVHRLPRLREGRQAGGDHHRGDVLGLHRRAGGSVMPICCSMACRLCAVNGACVVWSPVPSRPITRPRPCKGLLRTPCTLATSFTRAVAACADTGHHTAALASAKATVTRKRSSRPRKAKQAPRIRLRRPQRRPPGGEAPKALRGGLISAGR